MLRRGGEQLAGLLTDRQPAVGPIQSRPPPGSLRCFPEPRWRQKRPQKFRARSNPTNVGWMVPESARPPVPESGRWPTVKVQEEAPSCRRSRGTETPFTSGKRLQNKTFVILQGNQRQGTY